MNPISQLKDRVLSKNKGIKRSVITDTVDLIRGLGCIGEIIGRNFEVYDNKGKLVYEVRQKPITIKQLNVLLKEYFKLKKEDMDNQAKAFGIGGKKGRKNGR